jgi:hypothetical protein
MKIMNVSLIKCINEPKKSKFPKSVVNNVRVPVINNQHKGCKDSFAWKLKKQRM